LTFDKKRAFGDVLNLLTSLRAAKGPQRGIGVRHTLLTDRSLRSVWSQ